MSQKISRTYYNIVRKRWAVAVPVRVCQRSSMLIDFDPNIPKVRERWTVAVPVRVCQRPSMLIVFDPNIPSHDGKCC
eukprot:scaffold452290_cov63-Attheya_sp.AAC.2